MSTSLASVSANVPQTLDLHEGLRRFGHPSFRPGQLEAIQALLEHGSLLLVAPTGGGKSLTYQLPAAMLPGTTLVVSPLVALMHDQVEHLRAAGVPATYLASTLPSDEIRSRMAGIAEGRFKLVYAAPERLVYPGFRGMLERLGLSLVAVDEAHCISEWGHDFRPEYLQIGALVAALNPPRVLACTATATPIVRDEIVARLGLPGETPQVIRGFARPNLALRVIELARPKDRAVHVDAILTEALDEPRARLGAAIVYAPTRKTCEEEARRLERQGWKSGAYHAGLTGKRRDRVQRAFMDRKLDVVVATNAFGMGIDRSDVRAVVHLAPPGSVEAYYQEVGRAGRDGEPAFGLMMVTSNDVALRRRLLESSSGDGPPPAPEVIEHKWNLFLELMRWAEGGSCRHDAILRYFGDEAETLHGCGRCDVCQRMDEDQASEGETTQYVRKALSGVARVHGRFGLQMAVKLLRGNDDDRLRRSGLDRVRTFGVLSERSETWVTQLLRRCVTAGWVNFSGRQRPVVFLTDEGKQVMLGERPARLLLPPLEGAASSKSRGTKRRSAAPPAELHPEAQALFEFLRQWRLKLAKTDGVPPYVVASDRTLRDVALLQPRTLDELAMAHGIGPSKLERYGQEILVAVTRAKEQVQPAVVAEP